MWKGLYWTNWKSIKNRMTVHRQQINNPQTRQIKLSEHLENCAINDEHKFSVIPFYKIKRSDEDSRKTMESFFISVNLSQNLTNYHKKIS